MAIALLFPGQGAQYVGMGKELYDHFPVAKKTFDQAAEQLGSEYVDVIFSGPEEKLRETKFTQVALFIVSMAAYQVLKDTGCEPSMAAGHSLGEYSALCAANAFDFSTGLNLVKARGAAIQEASLQSPGAMSAIVGLDQIKLEDICSQVRAKGVCEAVNFNCPGQIVIAGAVDAVEEAMGLSQKSGALKSIRLNVSGPFHSSLMKPAADKMAQVLEHSSIGDTHIPVVMNCDAQPVQSAQDIKKKLITQIDHAVQWEKTMRFMIQQGVTQFVEVGPGRVLSGLLRRIDKTKKALNIEDQKSAENMKNI